MMLKRSLRQRSCLPLRSLSRFHLSLKLLRHCHVNCGRPTTIAPLLCWQLSTGPPLSLDRVLGMSLLMTSHSLSTTPKGISPIPAITMNTSPEWSELFWDAPNDEIEAALSELISPFLGSAHVVEQQVKKWRFATPRATWSTPCWSDNDFSLSSQATHSVALGSRGISFGCCCRRDNYWVVHTTSVSSPSSRTTNSRNQYQHRFSSR